MAKIRHLMTPSPYSIGVEQPLAEAARRMRAHHIRHLPALRGGQLEGLISERDIALVGSLPSVGLEAITVEEAMSPAPYSVNSDTEIATVVKEMATHKYGSVVVVDEGNVVGIVTTTDCLGMLWDHLTRDGQDTSALRPSAVRRRISEEHVVLRSIIDQVEELARQVIAGEKDALTALRIETRDLYQRLRAHIDVEDQILGPALRQTVGFGKEREEQLLSHHAEQREQLTTELAELDNVEGPPLAERIVTFIGDVRDDMSREDRDLLNPQLLKDDPIDVGFGG